MKTTTLQAEVREERGKGPARRLRAQGKIPGVFYGPGLEPTPLTLSPKTLEKALRSDLRRNVVLKLQLGEKEELAMVRDLATDPVTKEIVHVDLYRVFEDRELELKVPFRTTGRSIGVVQGGVLNITRHYLPVRTKPANIPAAIEIDVTELDLKQSVAVKDLTLPEGVVCLLSPELTLASVLEDRRGQEEEELKAAEAAAAAAATAEGAAPVPGAEGEVVASEGDDKKKDKKKDED